MAIKTVAIIGTGNMAENLIRGFQTATIQISGILGRNLSRVQELSEQYKIPYLRDYTELPHDSLIVLAVKDDAIKEVSQKLGKDYQVVHTSGSVSMDQIQAEKRGVFYPLQTMTADRKIDFFQVPILLESNAQDLKLDLQILATQMSNKVREVDSEKRKKIHLAAVILNNFVTELVKLSGDYMKQIDTDPALLNPLLEETVSKIKDLGSEKALTGPAKRGDLNTVESHLEMLNGDLKEVYRLLSNIILKENGKL